MKSMNDLFLHMVKDVYHAEKQLAQALKQMAKKASSPDLQQAFTDHREETLGQIERLESVFEMLDRAPRGVPCEAMQGLVAEAKEVIEDAEDDAVLDAGLLAAAQAVEHYEIARYGTLIAWANQLGMKDAAALFEQTLAEEKKTDQMLSKLAVQNVNKKAA